MPELPVNQIVQGDCLEVMRSWPDGCVDMCVTSPPYWGLRNYGVDGQLGLEKTPAEYVANMVAVFREVRRVLADHGVLFLNLGDCYYQGNKGNSGELTYSDKQASNRGSHGTRTGANLAPNRKPIDGLKAKDLVGIPWMLAFALRDDGWYLRSALPWVKRSAMPESAKDRPINALEYVFMLTKKNRYWFDYEAVRQTGRSGPSDIRKMLEEKDRIGGKHKTLSDTRNKASQHTNIGRKRSVGKPTGRAFRNTDLWYWSMGPPYGLCGLGDELVGLDVNPEPMKESHYATFPTRLIEPLILAGCPQQVCRTCGKPRERIVERERIRTRPGADSKSYDRTTGEILDDGVEKPWRDRAEIGNRDPGRHVSETSTLGWTDCGHDDYRTGIVLDPFGGSGTTGVVAGRLKRDYILIELNAKYVDEIAKPRLNHIECGVPVEEQRAGQMGLFQE